MQMEFDFTTVLDRLGKDALAVDVMPYDNVQIREGFTKLPMWVADMNFATVPTVQEEIIRRVQHPTFGYYTPRQEYYDAIAYWHAARKGVADVKKEYLGHENGVLGGVSSALQAFTLPGEAVLLHAPCYVGFVGVVDGCGRKAVYSPLKKDENGVWRMDYEDMDRRIKENHIHFAIFCSPHNPCGRVWEKWEIEKAMEIYRENQCIVVSDEIWSDLILDGHTHTPTQSISEDAKMRTIAFYAPTKTFSLAGLTTSYHVVYNPYLRDRLEKAGSLSHYNSMNVLSMYALIGAYSETGLRWVNELCHVLTENAAYACDYIDAHFKGVSVARPQGTYMLYLDAHEWLKEHHCDMDSLLRKGAEVGVIWQDGRGFKVPDTVRLNLALPLSQVKEAMDRLDKHVFNA